MDSLKGSKIGDGEITRWIVKIQVISIQCASKAVYTLFFFPVSLGSPDMCVTVQLTEEQAARQGYYGRKRHQPVQIDTLEAII